jgi:hypothetical protein
MKSISNVRDQYKKREKLAAAQPNKATEVVLSQEAVRYCLAQSDPNGYGDWSLWEKSKMREKKNVC